MGYQDDDGRRDGWRDGDRNDWNRDRGGREQGRGGYGGYGGYAQGGYGHGSQDRGGHDRGGDDRGFINRAGDEVRSWFGDDEAQRRREADQRRWEQEHRMTGSRDNDSGPGSLGGGGFGTGWGNQAGQSWNRDRPGERGSYGASGGEDRYSGGGGERHYGRGEREGWFSDSTGGERGRRQGGSSGGYGSGSGGERNEPWGGGSFGGGGGSGGSPRGGDLHDPHYSQWRQRQIEDLDRDYDEYRREHQSRFEQEFGTWRSTRQGQRQALGKVAEHMEVVGSDGSHVGTVDKVRGDRIILAKSDPDAGGVHHSVPCSWVDNISDKVMLNKTAEDAKTEWRNEERSRA
jgi:hypothetical protein